MRYTFLITSIFFSLFFIQCSDKVHSTDVYIKVSDPIVSGNYISTYDVSANASNIRWYCGYKFSAIEHYGSIKIAAGNIFMDGDHIVGGNLQIDMKSISVQDITDLKDISSILETLQSSTFFNVDTFTTASITIDSVSFDPKSQEISLKENNCVCHGKMKIKGIMKHVDFPLNYTIEETSVHLHSNFKFDRTQWGINYASSNSLGILKDKIIDDIITLKIDLVSSR